MPQGEPLLTEHHILPVLRYKVNTTGAYTTAEAGTAFTSAFKSRVSRSKLGMRG